MIQFRYKNNKYSIFFYPCGCYAVVQKVGGNISREIKYDNKLTVRQFLKKLEKIDFM